MIILSSALFAWFAFLFLNINFVSGYPEFFSSWVFLNDNFNLLSNASNNYELLLSSVVPIKLYSNADTMKQDIIKDNHKRQVFIDGLINSHGNYILGAL